MFFAQAALALLGPSRAVALQSTGVALLSRLAALEGSIVAVAIAVSHARRHGQEAAKVASAQAITRPAGLAPPDMGVGVITRA